MKIEKSTRGYDVLCKGRYHEKMVFRYDEQVFAAMEVVRAVDGRRPSHQIGRASCRERVF